MPIDRAVPAMILAAASTSLVDRVLGLGLHFADLIPGDFGDAVQPRPSPPATLKQ